jgi:hypothetical protein
MNDTKHKHELPSPKPALWHLKENLARHEFVAWMPAGVGDRKLLALADHFDAKFEEVGPSHYRFRFGKKSGLFSKCRTSDGEFELEVTLAPLTGGDDAMYRVVVELRSMQRIPNVAFELRCYQVLREMYALVMGKRFGTVRTRNYPRSSRISESSPV